MEHFDPVRRIRMDSTTNFIPFGITKSQNLFSSGGISTDNQNITQVLLLQCEDLRHFFHTISEIPENTEIHFHFSHSDPSITIRNLLLYEIITYSDFNPENPEDFNFVWDVWYNFLWNNPTKVRFLEILKNLEINKEWKKNIPTLENVEKIEYLFHYLAENLIFNYLEPNFIEESIDERILKIIEDFSKEKESQNFVMSTEGILKSLSSEIVDLLGPNTFLNPAMKENKESFYAEVERYIFSGNFRRMEEDHSCFVCLNPTFFQAYVEMWDVPHKATPFHSFYPISNEQFKKHSSSFEFCQAILRQRISAFLNLVRNRRVQVSFYIEDPVQFCCNSTESSFDIIDTATLSDELGLANLILLTQRLLRNEFSILWTQTTSMQRSSVKQYLDDVLGVKVSLLPAIFGLRPLDNFNCGSFTPHGEHGRNCFSLRWSVPSVGNNPKPSLEFDPPEGVGQRHSGRNRNDVLDCIDSLKSKCFENPDGKDPSLTNAYTPLTLALILKSMTRRFDFNLMDALKKVILSESFIMSWKAITNWLCGGKLVEYRTARIRSGASIYPYGKDRYSTFNLRPRLYLIQKSIKENDIHDDNKEFHIIDNVQLNINYAGGLSISFLLPDDHGIDPDSWEVEVYDLDKEFCIVSADSLEEFQQEIFIQNPPDSTLMGSGSILQENFRILSFQENENCYSLVFEFRRNEENSHKRKPVIEISAIQDRPCRSVHEVFIKIINFNCDPLRLTFACPVRCHFKWILIEKRKFSIDFEKLCEESWPEDYQRSRRNELKLKLDHLPAWNQICNWKTFRKHLSQQPQTLQDLFTDTWRTCLGGIVKDLFTYARNGSSFLVLNCSSPCSEEVGFYIRIHAPLIRYSNQGTPLLCMTVYDRSLAKDLIKNQGLDRMKTTEDLRRIMPFLDPSSAFLFTDDVAVGAEDPFKIAQLRILLRRNSLLMELTEWQRKEVPVGQNEPWIATFVTPVYADHVVKRSDCPEVFAGSNSFGKRDNDVVGYNCAKCRKKSENSSLKRCSKCKNVYYCSRTCQTQDWQIHKRSCVIKN